ncbi:MAG: hypothetical protein WBD96_10650, partial [Pseudolabrys sp.]
MRTSQSGQRGTREYIDRSHHAGPDRALVECRGEREVLHRVLHRAKAASRTAIPTKCGKFLRQPCVCAFFLALMLRMLPAIGLKATKVL